MKLLFAVLTVALLAVPQEVFAAIGCTLSNPAQDLKYLFPEMNSYKEDLKEFPRLKDGEALFKALKDRLGSDLDPIYETYETPYTVYSVFKGTAKINGKDITVTAPPVAITVTEPPKVEPPKVVPPKK